MKLVNAKYGIKIEFEENKVHNLIVENGMAMAEIVNDLFTQSHGGEGAFILESNGKEMKISKCVECVLEPFSLSINSKKFLACLYDELGGYCNDHLYELKSELVQRMIALMDEIRVKSAYDIVYDIDYPPETIFKAMNVRFDEEYDSLCEKIIKYIKIVALLNTTSMVVFVNLKGFLQQWERDEIYQALFHNKLYALFVESSQRYEGAEEKSCIVDNDLCIIEV